MIYEVMGPNYIFGGHPSFDRVMKWHPTVSYNKVVVDEQRRWSLPRLNVARQLKDDYWNALGENYFLTPCQCGYHSNPVHHQQHKKLSDVMSSATVSKAVNLHLRTVAAAVQTSLISLRGIWAGNDVSSAFGNIDCNSNSLTIQTSKSSVGNWYPLCSLIVEFPVRVVRESSWEVTLSLPHQDVDYIFVLSVLAAKKSKDIIVHLVRKGTTVEIVGFCLVLADESYMDVQAKVEKLITNEMRK